MTGPAPSAPSPPPPGVDYAAVTAKGKWLAVCQACALTSPPRSTASSANLEVLAEGGLDVDLSTVDMALLASVQGGTATAEEAYQVLCVLGFARNAATAAAPVAPTTSGLDLTGLISGMYAVPNGDTRLKLQIDVVTKGKWAGWVFVKDGAVYGEGQRYGSQKPGFSYKGAVEDALRAIVADPQAAMAAYGHLTSTCGMCRRPLEDADSVARGIGPVCARKAGW